MPLCVQHREPREGWPLLTNETEVNGDSKSTNERGPSLVGSTEYTELQPLLSGVHSVMRVKSVLAGEGVGCTPTPSHYIYPHQ
jgi:hypothetical protein